MTVINDGFVCSDDLGPRLIEILGLPKHVQSFVINFHTREVVTIDCTYFPSLTSDEQQELEAVLASYKLVRTDDESDSDSGV